MVERIFQGSLGFSRPVGVVAAAAAACLTVYLYIRPALRDSNKPRPTAIAKGRDTRGNKTRYGVPDESHPYPASAFPGGRDVETPYGIIKVFEWGPEDGEKVLLLHGIGTPCIALGDMAKRFVSCGYRVMLFDWFGRGYSDAPTDLPFDDRLYTSQILLALASSEIPWTGSESFHILGYSLGGALAAAFATYFPHMLRSATLVGPGGLVRQSHIGTKSRLLYSEGVFPEWLIQRLAWNRLQPRNGPSADVPIDGDQGDIDFDAVPLSQHDRTFRVGDVIRWQLDTNDGFVGAYLSTIRNAPIYGQHELVWQRLGERLAARRGYHTKVPAGLPGGKICLILAEKDPIIVKDEWIEDSKRVLGEDGVDIRIVPGGHEVAISKGEIIADLAMDSWDHGSEK